MAKLTGSDRNLIRKCLNNQKKRNKTYMKDCDDDYIKYQQLKKENKQISDILYYLVNPNE